MSLMWQSTDPILLLTCSLENHQKLSKQAGITCANSQSLEKVLTLMRKTKYFEHALQCWEKKTSYGKTWAEVSD